MDIATMFKNNRLTITQHIEKLNYAVMSTDYYYY